MESNLYLITTDVVAELEYSQQFEMHLHFTAHYAEAMIPGATFIGLPFAAACVRAGFE